MLDLDKVGYCNIWDLLKLDGNSDLPKIVGNKIFIVHTGLSSWVFLLDVFFLPELNSERLLNRFGIDNDDYIYIIIRLT